MRITGLLFTFLLFSVNSFGLNKTEKLLNELDETIKNKAVYTQEKQSKIRSLKSGFQLAAETQDQYHFYLKLCKEYQSFKFDSAFSYSHLLIKTAYILKDNDKIALAKTEFANILISTGLFNEAIDTLKSVDLALVTNATKARYFSVFSRGYFDLESFSQSTFYSNLYRQKGMDCFDSALNLLPEDSWEYLSLNGQKYLKTGNNQKAISTLEKLIADFHLKTDELAIQKMMLAFTHGVLNQPDEALQHMIEAAILDLKGAKSEAVALFFVANYLYERGEVIRASKYINVALEDNKSYGSSFRSWQISQYLPVIKSEHILTIEDQKKKLFYLLIIVSILSITVLGAIVIIFKQLAIVRKSKNIVDVANNKLEKTNEELSMANRIKEEYIGYYFSINSQMVESLEKLKNSMLKKLKRKQIDEVILELENLNIHKEKEKMFDNFDKVFLKIFPDFVSEFNKLLKPEEQILLKEEQLLNTDLRIFALVRLGISDSEKIAKLLDYSLHTIYSYKTRIKNKSVYPNEEFEKLVMGIKHF